MRVVFVADYFIEDYLGGSEKSLQAIIDSAPMPVEKLHTKDFRIEDFTKDDILIFGNYVKGFTLDLIDKIAKSGLTYIVIESDFQYCIHQMPEYHMQASGFCTCHMQRIGKTIARLYYNSKAVFWKSHKHLARHIKVFPLLAEVNNSVISATYSDTELDFIEALDKRKTRGLYAIYKSPVWIKAYDEAKSYCQNMCFKYIELGGGMPYYEFLTKLAKCEALVFVPRGLESCSRISIEAKLLNCKLIGNDNIGCRGEAWFESSNEDCIKYLRGVTKTFWHEVERLIPHEVFA